MGGERGGGGSIIAIDITSDGLMTGATVCYNYHIDHEFTAADIDCNEKELDNHVGSESLLEDLHFMT